MPHGENVLSRCSCVVMEAGRVGEYGDRPAGKGDAVVRCCSGVLPQSAEECAESSAAPKMWEDLQNGTVLLKRFEP